MKKNYTTLLAAGALLILSACGTSGSKSETATEEKTNNATEVTYMVSDEASTVAWKGEVAGVYSHNGVIDIAEGAVMAKGETITGGNIVIDMTTIQPLDTASYTASGKKPQDLVDHLTTDDFFLVKEYPTASFKIKSHKGDQLTGDLTIRGITKEATATVSGLEVSPNSLKGSAKLVFNRQDFDVKWVHYMKDMVLSDDITLDIDLSASAK
ncbi:MAG: YceI family protein [Cyclobacteriaceae bacterium]